MTADNHKRLEEIISQRKKLEYEEKTLRSIMEKEFQTQVLYNNLPENNYGSTREFFRGKVTIPSRKIEPKVEESPIAPKEFFVGQKVQRKNADSTSN